jgi:formate dehydrogenase subunit gamma
MSAVERARRVREIADGHVALRGGLLPALHAVQDELGHLDPADSPTLAEVFGLSTAEVHGVVSFYDDFRTAPPPPHVVRVCRGEACQSVGSEELLAQVRDTLAGRADVEVGEVFCLGNCALGPCALLDGVLRGRVDHDAILRQVPEPPR